MNDINAERGVLAGILSHPEGYLECSDIIKLESFTEDSHQIIWKILDYICQQNIKIDLPTIYSVANTLQLDAILDKEYLKKLFKFPIEKDNIRKLAQKVRKLEIIRTYDTAYVENRCNVQSLTGDEPISKIMSVAEEGILNVSQSINSLNNEGVVHISEGLKEYLQDKINNPRSVALKTGFKEYDLATGGVRKGNIAALSAQRKAGKSFMTDNIAMNVVREEGIPVLVVDTEMPQNERQSRLIANISGVEINKIEDGRFTQNESELNRVFAAEQTLSEMKIDYIRVVGMQIDQIINHIRRWILQKVGFNESGKVNDCLVILDYFKLMDSSEIKQNLAEYQLLGFNLMKLHSLVAQYDIRCIIFLQQNREQETAMSFRIEWFASSLAKLLVKTDDELAENREYSRKLKIEFTRHGAGLNDGDYINIKTDFKHGKISEGPTRNQAAGLRTFQTNGQAQF